MPRLHLPLLLIGLLITFFNSPHAGAGPSGIPSQIPSIFQYWSIYADLINDKLSQFNNNFSVKVDPTGANHTFHSALGSNPFNCIGTEFLSIRVSTKTTENGFEETRKIDDCTGRTLLLERAIIKGQKLLSKSPTQIQTDGPTCDPSKVSTKDGMVDSIVCEITIGDNSAAPIRMSFFKKPTTSEGKISVKDIDLLREFRSDSPKESWVRFVLKGSFELLYNASYRYPFSWDESQRDQVYSVKLQNFSNSPIGNLSYHFETMPSPQFLSLKDFLVPLKQHLDRLTSIPKDLLTHYFIDLLPKTEIVSSIASSQDQVFKSELQTLISLMNTASSSDIQRAKKLLNDWNGAIKQGVIQIKDTRGN